MEFKVAHFQKTFSSKFPLNVSCKQDMQVLLTSLKEFVMWDCNVYRMLLRISDVWGWFFFVLLCHKKKNHFNLLFRQKRKKEKAEEYIANLETLFWMYFAYFFSPYYLVVCLSLLLIEQYQFSFRTKIASGKIA